MKFIIKSYFLFTLVVLLTPKCSSAQDSVSHPKNIVHVEVIGNGGDLSFNYDRYIYKEFSLRIGLSFLELEVPPDDGKAWFHSTNGLLVMADYLLLHYCELGIGVNYVLESKQRCNMFLNPNRCSSFLLTTRIGIRGFPEVRGFSFAVAITPFMNFSPFQIRFWGGISLGHSF